MRTTHPLLSAILVALAGCSGANPGDTSDTSDTGTDPGDWVSIELCIPVAEDEECPAAADVDTDLMDHGYWCDTEVREVEGEGTKKHVNHPFDDTDPGYLGCCYPTIARNAEPDCEIGRPFVEDGEVVTAPVVDGDAWSCAAGAPDPARAEMWRRMAIGEHASIASFARLTLQLMALGAPADLIEGVQQAGLDEVVHARLAFGLASRYAGRPLQPGAFPLDANTSLRADPSDLAEAAVREGCLGETVGAWLAAEAAATADDPAERAALEQITRDETRHAALSWRLVAWLMEIGGEPVRERVKRAFAGPFGVSDPLGVVDAARCERVHAQVLTPAYRALLAA